MEREITLETIGNGGLLERFREAWDAALASIADPNFDAQSPRKVVIELVIRPTPNRSIGRLEYGAHFAGLKMRPAEALLFFTKKDGQLVALGQDDRQEELFSPGVQPITKAG